MGMSASQARLLMLTARKSDLEYQAQQICQAKLALARESEELATRYADAVGNRQYSTLMDGRDTAINGHNIYQALAAAGCTDYYINEAGLARKFGLNINNTVQIDTVDQNGKAIKKNVIDLSSLNATDIYDAIDAGLIAITDSKGNIQSASSFRGLRDENYTDDDGAAEAKYNAENKKIQTKEKQLDMNLKQIETQHTAVTNEMESVEKIVKDNVEKTFKTFA